MTTLTDTFQERLSEIDLYLDLLDNIESSLQDGLPKIGSHKFTITTDQQRILYSSVYLQLYNLIEATITKCIDAVCIEVTKDAKWSPGDLSEKIRTEWVRFRASTHVDLNYENRLSRSMILCDHLISTLPINTISIEKGGGGNWDDEEIYKFLTKRLGCNLEVPTEIQTDVKKPFRNNKGALALIVQMRNDLAHGNVSFLECGTDATVKDLRDLKIKTAKYMEEIVSCFNSFISNHEYLNPSSRP